MGDFLGMLSRRWVAIVTAAGLFGLAGTLVYSAFVGQGAAVLLVGVGLVLLNADRDRGEAYLLAGLAVFLLAGMLPG